MRMDRKWPFDASVLMAVAFAVCGSLAATAAFAAEPWPARSVRVIVPHPAGGSVDAVARIVIRKLADVLGKPFIVENRGGANGNIGAAAAASAPSDGYKALAVATLNRTAILPEAALAEQGMPKFEAVDWTALLGPAGLAPETIGTITRIVNEFLVSDEGKSALLNFGMEPLGGTPEDVAGFMASELTKWRPVAEKLTPE
jgi:tripartite-type tricarboxylate transporter receptor subunit TctC